MGPIRSYVGTHFLIIFEHFLTSKSQFFASGGAFWAGGGPNFSVNGSMHLCDPKAAEVGAISGLKLRKWRALARQEARAG